MNPQQKTRTQITFVTNKICPFAHRVWIMLQNLNLDYSTKELPIFANNQQLKNIYQKAHGHDPTSNGRVPVLIEGNFILAESTIIVEYLAYKYGFNNKTLADPKAMVLSKIFNKKYRKIISYFYIFRQWHSKDNIERQKLLQELKNSLKSLDDSLVMPYALGSNFTVADIMIYPWLARWVAIQKHIGIGIDKEFTKINKWIQNIEQRQEVKKTMINPELFIKGYESYFMKSKL